MKDPLKSCPGSTTETLTTNKPSFMHNLLCPMKPEQDASALSKSPSSSFPIKKPPSKHNMLHPIKPERDVPTFVSSSSSPIEQKPSFKPHELLYPMKPEQDGELLKWVNLMPLDMIRGVASLAATSPELGAELQASSLRDLLTSCNGRVRDVRESEGKMNYLEENFFDTDAKYETFTDALIAFHGDRQLFDGSATWKPPSVFGVQFGDLTGRLERLLAADPKSKWCLPSYGRVQQACSSVIKEKGACQDVVSELAVKRVTSQMQVLVEMVSMQEPKAKNSTSRLAKAKNFLAIERQPTCSGTVKGLLPPDYRPSALRNEGKNDVFQSTMIAWIKNNFAFPFPDEVMLRRLAIYMIVELGCITINKDDAAILEASSHVSRWMYRENMINIATEKMSNWLVNTRTRKVSIQEPKVKRVSFIFIDVLRLQIFLSPFLSTATVATGNRGRL